MKVPSGQGGGLVLRVPDSQSLEHGHGSVGGAITLGETLIHLSEDGGRLKLSIAFSTNVF